jgi:hypothetical protein
MEPKLILYLSSSMLGEWQASMPGAHPAIVTLGKTRAEAHERFDAEWNGRADYRIVEGPAPQANLPSFVKRAGALAACHQRWSQRLRLNAKDGLVDSIECLAALDELLAVAQKG